MLQDQTPVAFVACTDPARAKQFYAEVLGLPVVSESGFATVFRVAGTTLRLQHLGTHTPAQHTVFGWEVRDLPALITALSARGVRFERYPGMAQDALGVWRAPDGTGVAWFKDPDGNVLSLAASP